MKKTFYTAVLLTFILVSCEDKMPEAHFSIDAYEPEVGQPVLFNNSSKNADSFLWNFGDGLTSTEKHPEHIFTGSGFYTVTLTAYNDGMEDVAEMDIEIFIPTLLEVDVFEWNEEWTYDFPIPGASVWLFPTLSAWDSNVGHIAEGYTDNDGVVVFSHLDEYRYYVDVYHQNYNNYLLRDEDVGFIETDIVVPHKINWFVAWVDYVEAKGADGDRRDGYYVIKKLERKVIDTPEPGISEGWEALYESSVKVK
ncbi:MAG TPA: PKD domain-containing protein [Bacteroidales bacterium]|nr:PKD domain-containing protein [Bacteroidales bacterium]HPJ60768.1 PKD domain-containing protein [Bacteroidales bacterium]HPR13542.1 PKD domain-containing protein [Bacteroidales bacterium]HRW86627.1 PKD domain-containing protein [Bacteroidales bacterium]